MVMEQPDRLHALAGEVKELAKHLHKSTLTRSELAKLLPKLPLLGVSSRSSDADPHARFAAIGSQVQAVVTRLCTVEDDESSQKSRPEIEQMRRLFGLTDETRWLTWGERQRAAAQVTHHSVNTFRREPQERILHEIAAQISRPGGGAPASGSTPLRVFPGQTDVRPWLIRYIREAKPRNAKFVLASGAASVEVFAALREVAADVTLLLRHPDFAITRSQRDRVESSVREIRQIWFTDYRKELGIFLYRAPASIRGWRIGDYVGLSWYTYRDDTLKEQDHPEQTLLSGHDNAVIIGDSRTRPGVELASWFDRETKYLLDSRRTVTEDEFQQELRVAEQSGLRPGSRRTPNVRTEQ